MSVLRDLIINISANSQSFQNEISRATKIGNEYNRSMQAGGYQAAAAQRESQRALAGVSAQLGETRAMALRLSGAVVGAFATTNLINIADGYNSLSARIKLATTDSTDFANAQRGLMDISQRTGSALADNASLFSRASSSLREWGYGTQDILKLTDALANGLQVSGASAEETSSLIVQLSQALGRGVLRGQDFNSVAQSGQRIMKALAEGMGVAQKDLKAMADEGKLTTDKIVPALISQLGKLKDEFNSMPNSVSAASTRINNAFMEWVGGANQSSGATATISGVMDDLAKNIDSFATGAGALVAVGLARYLGGIVTSATSATGSLLSAAKSEVALAVAQEKAAQSSVAASRAEVYRAQQALAIAKSADAQVVQQERVAAAVTRVTAANTALTAALANGTASERFRAKAALDRAQAALVATKSTDAQTIAERRLAVTQAGLNRNISSRSSAQQNINSITSAGTRIMSGALGVIGGVPGLVMLGAGAWYAMYQKQEQARASAIQYLSTLEQVRATASKMSLPEVDENRGKTISALQEQNRLVSEQEKEVIRLKSQIKQLNATRGASGLTSENDVNIVKAVSVVTDQLAVAEEKLYQLREKSSTVQQTLRELERNRNDLIKEQAWRQNQQYQSLLMMNGQHTEFNRLLGLGNNLLMARQGLVSAPVRVGQADLTSPQQAALDKSRQDLELSRLKGETKERRRLEFSADNLGLKDEPQFSTARQKLISNGITEWKNTEASKPEKKGPKSTEEKTEDVYKRLIKQQQEQVALASQNTELAKIKYQITQGELSALSRTQKDALMRNALAIDAIKTQEEFKSLQKELLTPEEALLQKTRERIKLLKEASPASNVYKDTMERISKESVTSAPEFAGIDASVGGPSGELIKVADAEKELNKWHKKELENQQSLLDQKIINEQTYADRVADINKTNADRLKEIQSGYTSASLSMFSDLASQSATLLQGIGQEGTAAYRMLFVASKAAAIAQAVINTELAATKAMAEGGLILGMPAATVIRAAGYASVGIIAGQTLAGMAHDGIDRVPETGTWLLQKGERVVTASTSAKLDATLEKVRESRSSGSGVRDVNISYQLTGKPDDTMLIAMDAHGKKLARDIKAELAKEVISPQGMFGNALKSRYVRGYKE